jgi:endonuclease/exonuclease/phosphatase family metal-dependent hydrolase
LRQKLEETGLKYPYHASTIGEDDRIQNVLLSKFPIREDLSNNSQAYSVNRRNRQTGELYPLKKRMERGLVNCLIEVTPACRVRVLLVHLKSPLPVFGLQGDKPCEAGDEIIRRNEALIVRAAINDLLDKEPDARLVVMGDFNDNLRSKSLQTIRGGGLAPAKRLTALDLPDFLGEYWTHFYAPEREYTQIDHILVSPVLLRELCRQQSFVYRAQPGDGMELDPASASDHRPVYAVFLVPR